MQAALIRVFLPHAEVLLHVDALDAVERDHVELTHRFVVLGRVARRDNDPALGQFLVAEGLALQELQHHRGQRLGNAVDLIQKQDALAHARALHEVVNRGQDLAHGIGRDRVFLAIIYMMVDIGQAEGALAGVMGDGIGDQAHTSLGRNLLHDLGLANARRAHQQDRTLAHGRDLVLAERVAGKVGFDGIGNLLFGSFDVHWFPPVSSVSGSSTTRMPQGGTRSG